MTVDTSTTALDESRLEQYLGIAEHLAELSLAMEAPTGFTPADRTYSADDIDFEGADWMDHVVGVKGWLQLTVPLDEASPDEFVMSLARGIGGAEALETIDGAVRLSTIGLERLRARAERAVRLQQEFVQDIEGDSASLSAATKKWLEAWEEFNELDEVEDEDLGPVTAKTHVWSINEFSSKAIKGKLDLSPSYQRGDVWPTKDSQMLIESILRGIPLPSVILLKPAPMSDKPFEVVDGKQRLTAILRYIGKHPGALERVRETAAAHPGSELVRLFAEDYPLFRRAWKNATGDPLTATQEKDYYFPFKLQSGKEGLQGDLAQLQGRYYTEIMDTRIRIADDESEIGEIFDSVSEYKVPVIEYSRASRRQIHNVFNLYNKQGKHLNAEEIRNAVYHDVDMMRSLLVAAGDGPVSAAEMVIGPTWGTLREVQAILKDYNFGTSRYRRTKLLSWVVSLLLLDTVGGSGDVRLRSTAGHIDTLLSRIEEDSGDALRQPAAIRDALGLLHVAMCAHSAVDEAWAPLFKDGKSGAKWQELQLVASLLGVAIAAAVLGSGTEERLEDVSDELRALTSLTEWQRPLKTQTGTQWYFIAKLALRIAEAMGVDRNEAESVLDARFGSSGIATLVKARLAGEKPERD